jgi:hypothetical protein
MLLLGYKGFYRSIYVGIFYPQQPVLPPVFMEILRIFPLSRCINLSSTRKLHHPYV